MSTAHERLDAWIDAHFDQEVRFLQELVRRIPVAPERTPAWLPSTERLGMIALVVILAVGFGPSYRVRNLASFQQILERAPEGGYQWDLTQLARYEHHEGLCSLAVRVVFRVLESARKLEAVRIDCELGACTPVDPNWQTAKQIALCAATSHV